MVFPSHTLAWLVQQHRELFKQLAQVEAILKQRFSGLDEAVDAVTLAVLSGEALLLVGPPGTAKSRLIRAFCSLLGLLDLSRPDTGHPDYFEYLLTPFTEPGELFGFYDVTKASAGRLERMAGNWLQTATVVYLDEMFNGSSAILNSLLAIMNEHVFHDRGKRTPVAMECLFAATNDIPESPELRAVFDRFLLRCVVKNVDVSMPGGPQRLGTLLERGWAETYGNGSAAIPTIYGQLLARAATLREHIADLTLSADLPIAPTSPFFQELARVVRISREDDLSEMSNRRLVKMLHVMLVHCLYEAAKSGNFQEQQMVMGDAQLALVRRFFLDRVDEEIVRKMTRMQVG